MDGRDVNGRQSIHVRAQFEAFEEERHELKVAATLTVTFTHPPAHPLAHPPTQVARYQFVLQNAALVTVCGIVVYVVAGSYVPFLPLALVGHAFVQGGKLVSAAPKQKLQCQKPAHPSTATGFVLMSTCPTEWFDLDDRLSKWHKLRIAMYASLTLLGPVKLAPGTLANLPGLSMAAVAAIGALGPLAAPKALPSPATILALWQVLDPIMWGWHYIMDVATEPTTLLRQMKMVEGGMWIGFATVIAFVLAYQRRVFDLAYRARVAAASAARGGGGPVKLAPGTLANLPGLSPNIGAYAAGYARLGLYGIVGLIMGMWIVVARGTPIGVYILLKALIFLVPVVGLLAVGREFLFEHMARRFDRSHAKSDGAFIAEVRL